MTREEINEKISSAMRTAKCRTCGAHATRKFGGTGKFCAQHKSPTPGSVSFDDLKSDYNKKQRLIKEHGHKCWGCKLEAWRGQLIPLQLEHKDGNPDNSSRENLELLCPNCHAQTPTFGGRNKGKFPDAVRHGIREKYR